MTRVLYIPHTSSPERLVTDHCYGWATSFFRTWLDKEPYLNLYWLVPRGAPVKQREVFSCFSGKELRERVKLIEVDTNITQVLEQSTYPQELIRDFNANNGKYYFDILFCEKPSILGWFFNNAVIYAYRRKAITVVLNVHYAINSKDNISVAEEFEASYYANAAFANAYLFCNDPRANIDSQSSLALRLKKYFAPSKVSDMLAKPNWVKINSDIPALQKLAEKRDISGDEFRIHFGFSISNLFNFKVLLKFFSSFRVILPLKWVITTPSGSLGRGGKKPEEWLEVHLECPREEFFRIALRSHCFVCWPSVFSSGLNHGGVMEMARLGVVPVFYSKALPWPWFELWPDYPFQFSGEEELAALLKYIKENFGGERVKETARKSQEIIDHVFEERGHRFIIDQVTALQEKAPKYAYNAFSALIHHFPHRITMRDAVKVIKEESDTSKDLDKVTWVTWFKTGTKLDLRQYMLSHGWRDIGNVDSVVFERVDG